MTDPHGSVPSRASGESQAQTPVLLEGRYAFTADPVREGGMATVRKAYDIQESRHCAIKRVKPGHDEARWKESFNREYKALQDVSDHPNIVSLYDAGSDQGANYLVLEWVEGNLVDWIAQKGAMTWDDFFAIFGRPLLEALAYAQARRWCHRDIKPMNILVTESGTPKISDYGIAKQTDRPALGLTFSGFRSAPFTPPEDDNGAFSEARDCFSWAAVAVFCLTGKIPSDYGALAAAAAGLTEVADTPIAILQNALSHDPPERPPSASVLLADLEAAESARADRAAPLPLCHLQVAPHCVDRLMRALDASDRDDVIRHLSDELDEVLVGFRSAQDGVPGELRIFAVTLTLQGRPSPSRDRIVITSAWQSRATENERHREASFRPAMRISLSQPRDQPRAAEDLEEMLIRLEAFEHDARERSRQASRERVFRLWYAFLRAKADAEARRQSAVPFIDFKAKDSTVTLATELPAPAELLGQSRVVRLTSGGHLFCDVIDVNALEVTVAVTGGDLTRIPRRGKLEVNTVAAEKALERQRRALDAVNYDRAPSPRLKAVIVEPATNRPPLTVPIQGEVGGGPFDPEKAEVLRRALGVQDVLAIQGPPGTGKTRLIEEILVQSLERNPRGRILLSAQTHVALDNVIERVREREPAIDIVRIGRLDDAKISASCRDLILDRKAHAWSERVRARAHAYMTDWARDRGIERSDVETGMLVERLTLLLQRLKALRSELGAADAKLRKVTDRADAALTATGSDGSPELQAASVEAEQRAASARGELARVRADIEETRVRLRDSGSYGVELADREEGELSDWSSVLLGEGEGRAQCRRLLELQEDWMLRVGRSSDFHAAMLASAQVVAGTCIGMAGVRGMDDVAYDLCIVDEASKATATEILVPMSRSRRWILVGDPQQLPPFFEQETFDALDDADAGEMRETMLDRLLGQLPQHSIARLANQHRMVKAIGDLISEVFYQGRLNSPRTKPVVTLPGIFPKPVTWLSTAEIPDAAETRLGKSYRNEAEARVIRQALDKIDFVARKRKAVYDVALIAGYVAQVRTLQDAIRDRLHEWEGLRVTCSTVDAFQGSEAELCVYSVTRSNTGRQLGFLREKPRLNVALSRGRSLLLIVGDDEFVRGVSGDNPFRKVLDFIEAHPDGCERRPA